MDETIALTNDIWQLMPLIAMLAMRNTYLSGTLGSMGDQVR